ncbi:AcrR family transcriptional regulator [Janthinobacterium sp. CG_23.3]|uniref:TetR/AcrR family transcriptional regulator n=1 Tax=unclassified Janthinobacterium TaxID=2610881 RepID=UPI00034BCEFE|nr:MULTISPECIES: TetR/AcrR family transcriptional regulator [unclassified Janthinobacterium]MEC5160739.1 AcrR family transcriptional regulator [Janthinobacterium sp. CG_S6]
MIQPPAAPKQRLSREDWLDFGLTVLRDEGAQALKAEPLCKRLGVTRGSFYWHFESAGSFMLAVVERWEARATEQVMALVERQQGSAIEKLRFLLRKVGRMDIQFYEAINHLGGQNPELAAVLRRVHDRRVHFLAKLLGELGLEAGEAQVRAHIIYAWAMGELLTRERGLAAYTEAQIGALERLLMTC